MSNTNNTFKMNTLHPDHKLRDVPPSFDETVTYNHHVSLFLHLPKQLFPKRVHMGVGQYTSEELDQCFWVDLNICNKKDAKQSSKLLCVLFTSKNTRQEILTIIEEKENKKIWAKNNVTDAV